MSQFQLLMAKSLVGFAANPLSFRFIHSIQLITKSGGGEPTVANMPQGLEKDFAAGRCCLTLTGMPLRCAVPIILGWLARLGDRNERQVCANGGLMDASA